MAREHGIVDTTVEGLAHGDVQPTQTYSGGGVGYDIPPHMSLNSHLPPCTSGRLDTGAHLPYLGVNDAMISKCTMHAIWNEKHSY